MTDFSPDSVTLPMNSSSTRHRTVLRLVGILLFYTILYTLFFSPIIFNGKLLAHGDGEAFFYPVFITPKTAWTPNWFGGFPMTADPQTMSFYPPARLLSMLPAAWHPAAWNVLVISAYALGSEFMCCFVLALTGSLIGGLGAGVIFGMSGFMVSHGPQPNMIHTAVWIPLMLLAVIQLRRRIRVRWIVLGASAVGLCILAGHPQLMVYALAFTGCYALVLAMGSGSAVDVMAGPGETPMAQKGAVRWRFLVACLFMGGLGVALAAVQLLPSYQLSRHSVREAITFANFTIMSFSWDQLSLLIFPFLFGGASKGYQTTFIGVGGFTEVVGYAGIISLALAGAAIRRRGKNLHVWFFTVAAVVSVLLAMGSYTPLARLMYHLPVFDLFRVQSRHYMEWTICVAILAGIGLSVLDRDPRRRSTAMWAGIGLVLCMLAGCLIIVLARGPLSHAFARGGIYFSSLPWRNPAIGVPLLLAVAGALALWMMGRFEHRATRAILLAVLIADLGSFSFFLEWRVHSPTITDQSIPRQLIPCRDRLQHDHQRLAVAHDELGHSLHGRPNSPFGWGISSATGYNPLVLRRYQRITRTDVVGTMTAGSIRGDALPEDRRPLGNRAFDLLATRYLITSRQSGLYFQSLILSADSSPLRFMPDLPRAKGHPIAPLVDELKVVSAMGASIEVADDVPVAEIVIEAEDGTRIIRHLRAGRDTAEQAWERPDVKATVRHRRAPVARSVDQETYVQHYYLGRFQFQRPIHVRQVLIRPMMSKPVELVLTQLTLHPAPGAGLAGSILLQSVPLHGQAPWWRIDQFDDVKVYENRRAMPRAWLVSQVRQMPPERIADSIVSGYLPDGKPFKPREMAMIETPPPALPARDDASHAGSAEILKITPTTVTVRTHSPQDTFLVLSDVNYPGWTASIDGQPAPIDRTDYLLRGLPVPAGEHTVHFVFRSKTLGAGMAISGAAIVALLGVAVAGWRKSRSQSSAS